MLTQTRLIYVILLAITLFNNVLAATSSPYQEAVINSSLHKPQTSLKPLTIIQGPSVKMVVFTTYDGYKTSDKELQVDIWTTVAPELKQLCSQHVKQNKNISREQLNLWVAQLLGLPANTADKRRLVEMEVPVIQAHYGAASNNNIGIFRPCTDPRIGRHSDASPICPKQMNPNDPNISSDFKTWFINNSITSYTFDNGFPWTEYGYTYNWNEQASSAYGLSEFIVLKGTPITVLPNPNDSTTAYINTEEYCGKN